MSQVLAAALAKLLNGGDTVATSTFTTAQRRALEELARKTGALRVKSEGRGSVYQVVRMDTLVVYLRSLRPLNIDEIDPSLPKRAANIAQTRSSKGAEHGHVIHYLVIKAISDGVTWKTERDGFSRCLDLSAVTDIAGAGVLALADDDSWQSEHPLWLVENQALFDRMDWLPPGATGTVGYYAGQLPGYFLRWIAAKQRTPEVILFPDYDGVGLLNYARLREVCAGPCSFWLMPDWQARLNTFGNHQVWLNTYSDFQSALTMLEAMGREDGVLDLCKALSSAGMALEHESVWLAAPQRSSPLASD
ncbi:MAG: hypothetical protein ORN21_02750 [Methylophilaceae bacterium]|nr:hypothetical protein [Methylophilaceae bacterium]